MSKTSILIVEDERIVALDIENSLSNAGYSIAGQTDRGENAVMLAKEMRPDLVLMDIGLRGELSRSRRLSKSDNSMTCRSFS